MLALGTLKGEPRITEAFRTGVGMGWHEHDEDVFTGCEQFFRPGYIANLVPSWIPVLDSVDGKLRAGVKVADIGWPTRPFPSAVTSRAWSHPLSCMARSAPVQWITRLW